MTSEPIAQMQPCKMPMAFRIRKPWAGQIKAVAFGAILAQAPGKDPTCPSS